MNRASPQMRNLAKHLMAAEALTNKSSESEHQTAFHAPHQMRPHLAVLMGKGGFQALLSRALALARAEVPWLSAIRVATSGSVEGFEDIQPELDSAAFLEGKVVLLAQLLGLLVTFIGPRLTERMAGQIWPEISPGDWDFGKEVNYEKAR